MKAVNSDLLQYEKWNQSESSNDQIDYLANYWFQCASLPVVFLLSPPCAK